jgi:predicted dehydrogenase
MRPGKTLGRRAFIETCGALGATAAMSAASPTQVKKTRVGVIGCGSVSRMYLPHLASSAHVELVSTCDRIPERAATAAERYGLSAHYPSLSAMIEGVPFDLLVNLTDMQEHEHLNREALDAGRHVWSEKPLANSYQAGTELLESARSKGLKIWGAPAVVVSPQFAFMSQCIQDGRLGHVAAAHASYGHLGPGWSAFFYEAGGGSLPDLGVYNLTTLTGLLGPAKCVVALTAVIQPERTVENKGRIKVEAEDNSMILLDHGSGTFSHVQCGFNYFDPHGHDGSGQERATISIVGNRGAMHLVGYDWAPSGVDLATLSDEKTVRHLPDAGDYVWQMGASLAAESLATGRELPIRAEHALHVVEIMKAALESQTTGRRIELKSTFPWPIAV